MMKEDETCTGKMILGCRYHCLIYKGDGIYQCFIDGCGKSFTLKELKDGKK